MKEILMWLLIVVYLGFGYRAVQYIKVNILGITAEWTNNLIAYYGQVLCIAAAVGWAAIPIAIIHKAIRAK